MNRIVWMVAMLVLPAATLSAKDVAIVNGTPITHQEIVEHLKRSLGSKYDKLNAKQRIEAVKDVRQQLIRAIIIEQEMKRLGIEVSEEDARKKIGDLEKQCKAQGKQLADVLQKSHSHYKFLLRVMKGTIGMYRVCAKTVTDESVQRYFRANPTKFQETVRVRHILTLTIDAKTRNPLPLEKLTAAKTKFDDIKTKLAADGSNFATLARTMSDCPSKAKGGELPRFGKTGRMDPSFSKAAFGLANPGDVKYVRTKFGHHLIQLIDRYKPVWKDAREPLIQAKSEAYLKELLTKSKIERKK